MKLTLSPIIISSFIVALFLMTGFWRPPAREGVSSSFFPPDTSATIQGVLKASPKITSSGTDYIFSFAPESVIQSINNRKVYISFYDTPRFWRESYITILVKKEILFPFFDNDPPLDIGDALIIEGTSGGGIFFGKSVQRTKSLKKTRFSFLSRLYHLRGKLRARARKALEPLGNCGTLSLMLLLGDRLNSNSELLGAFRLTGTSFILALSGMHLSFWAAIVLFWTKRCGKWLSIILSTIVITAFFFIAGSSPSLLRSYIFFLYSIAFIIFSVKPSLLARLSFTFLTHIILSPGDFWTIAFQLSYLSVLGMVVLSPFIITLLSRFLPNFLSLPLTQGLSCNLMTSYLSIKTFGYYCPVGIIAGVVLSPLIALFMLLSLVTLILLMIFCNATFIAFPLKIVYRAIIFFLSVFSNAKPVFLSFV